jgi:DNA-binding NtrC family response regulator
METQTTLASGVVARGEGTDKQETVTLDVSSFPTMEELERQYLNLVLEKNGGNKVQTAKILGFSVKTIYNKLDGYKSDENAEAVRTRP